MNVKIEVGEKKIMKLAEMFKELRRQAREKIHRETSTIEYVARMQHDKREGIPQERWRA